MITADASLDQTATRTDGLSRLEALGAVEREVGVLVRRARRAVGERAATVHPDLHPVSYLLLSTLAESGDQRPSSLGCALSIDKGAVSRCAQHLEQLGLVERLPDPDDGRAHLLHATDEARDRLQRMSRVRRELLQNRLGEWSASDLCDLISILQRYNATLEGHATDAPVQVSGRDPECDSDER